MLIPNVILTTLLVERRDEDETQAQELFYKEHKHGCKAYPGPNHRQARKPL
jgi:hypothetical protein